MASRSSHRLGDHAVLGVDEVHDLERRELVDAHAARVALLRQAGIEDRLLSMPCNLPRVLHGR
jgi:hypothetical protein